MASLNPARFELGKPMLLGGLRQRHELAAADLDLARQWQEFKSRPELPGRVGANCYGVMCGADSAGFEYMCGVEVESFVGLPAETGRMRVPAQRYAVFAHHARTATLRFTWLQILEWLASGDFESAHAPDFELYGPDSDPIGGVGAVEVWVGVVPRIR
jgi:AraC family transcriptional regulator